MRPAFPALAAATLFLAAGAETSLAQKYGNLSGQVIYDGEAPELPPIVPAQNGEICINFNLKDESLMVDPKSKGIANVVVTLYPDTGQRVRIHRNYNKLARKPVVMSNVRCRFEPRVAVLWTKRELELANGDPTDHNMFALPFVNDPFNELIPKKPEGAAKGPTTTKEFKKGEERLPVEIKCSIHGWMKGWLVVKDHPYVAVTDKVGKFKIADLPEGKWKFQFWQERAGYLSKIKLGGKDLTGKRGVYELEVKSGDNDIGSVVVAPSMFPPPQK